MPSAPLGTSNPPRVVRSGLDSWKEIADYLKKGERTAKRWKKERSLPVHHVPGGGHGSVYAFAAELDKWLLSEKPKEANSWGDRPEPSDDSGSPGQPVADPSASRLILVEAAPPSKRFRPVRRILRYAFLTTGAAIVVIYFLNLHTVNAYTTSFVRSLLIMKTYDSNGIVGQRTA